MSLVKVIINIKKDQLTISYKRHLGLNSEGSSRSCVFSGNSVIVFRNQSFLSKKKKKTHQFFRCYVCADEVQSDALIWSDLTWNRRLQCLCVYCFHGNHLRFHGAWSCRSRLPAAARLDAVPCSKPLGDIRDTQLPGKKKKNHQPNLFNQTQEEHVWGVARRYLACSKFGQMRWRWANEDLHTSQSSQQI